MRSKIDFVTNSSSTAYMIKNRSKKDNLTAKAFVDTIWPHIQDLMEYYGYEYTKTEIFKSLEKDYPNYFPIKPKQEKSLVWGDNDGTIAGEVFDYVLRDEIETGLVKIKIDEYLR